MAVTVTQVESDPEFYPEIETPEGVSPAAVWRRIEHYCTMRWSRRTVTWTVSGSGEWVSPLNDATVMTFETWQNGDWIECDPGASPLGYFFNGSGPHRVFAMVGKTSAPEDVTLAANRLAAYLGEASSETAIPGATGGRNEVGDVAWSVERSANWLADAMRKSGAADLLRRYRKPPGSDYDIL